MKRVPWVTIGVIVGAHGINGEVRVKPLTDFPERLLTTQRCFVQGADGERTEFVVERARPHGRGLYILKFRGVTDRDQAEGLRKLELQVPREEAVPLPKDSYYVFDLIGSEVYTVDGVLLGRLVDVIQTGANDVFQVRNSRGQEVLIPGLKEIFKQIDIDVKRIVVDLPEGLMEEG